MKRVLTFLAAAVCAALAISCNEDQPLVSLPTATLSADEAFVDGKANITVTLSAAAPVDITATLAYGTAREGKTAIDIAALKFDEKVVLKAGEKVATCTVELVSAENIADADGDDTQHPDMLFRGWRFFEERKQDILRKGHTRAENAGVVGGDHGQDHQQAEQPRDHRRQQPAHSGRHHQLII